MGFTRQQRPTIDYLKGFFFRLLHHPARHLFPSVVRVRFHRWRGVKIGKGVFIGLDVHIDDDNPTLVTLEDDVTLSSDCLVLTHRRDMKGYRAGGATKFLPMYKDRVLIKKGANIGAKCVIMPGVTIGEGAIVGAGSIVTADIPPYCLAVGAPARVVKNY
jgi:acetyltransferase-like isoleucine patch superfamily enzyme